MRDFFIQSIVVYYTFTLVAINVHVLVCYFVDKMS